MTKPVTWDQIIDAASDNGATVGVQANKYEGYVVWINALVEGAGGHIVSDTASRPGRLRGHRLGGRHEGGRGHQKLASSPAAEPDLSVSNEGTVLGPLGGPKGGFMVNWTFAYNNYKDGDVADDLGYARYPETVAGEQSRPPIGGINVGVSPYGSHVDLALEAVKCITSEKEQVTYAIETANMPARQARLRRPELRKQFPADLLELWQ